MTKFCQACYNIKIGVKSKVAHSCSSWSWLTKDKIKNLTKGVKWNTK